MINQVFVSRILPGVPSWKKKATKLGNASVLLRHAEENHAGSQHEGLQQTSKN